VGLYGITPILAKSIRYRNAADTQPQSTRNAIFEFDWPIYGDDSGGFIRRPTGISRDGKHQIASFWRDKSFFWGWRLDIRSFSGIDHRGASTGPLF
jgi:hypothetical protein